jgi:hypothetical protein
VNVNPHSSISADTIRAYEETEYRVHTDMPMTLRIGIRNALLADLHRAHDVDCSAFITAVNPLSLQTDHADNLRRQAKLADELKRKYFELIDGIGQHPSGEWPGEPSFLVIGISLDAAKELGTRYKQNAIVWCGDDAVPQLILLR